MSFEAVRGIQANREFYNAMCSFATIYHHFKFNDDPQIPPNLRAQRKLRTSRIPEIANYIIQNPQDYIFSSITVSVGGKVKFNPSPGQGEDGRLGQIIIPIDAPILINDGQHRCAAIKYAYEKKPELASEKVSVVVFEDKGLKRSQQMFADLNKHAVKPTRSLGLLYDHRDTFARFVVNLVNDVDVFHGRTETEKTNISNRSTNFFTLNGIADATKFLLRLKTKSIAPEKQKIAVDFWDRVSKNIPEWNLLIQKKVSAYELRQNYVHAHTNVLTALGMFGNVMITHYEDSWREKIKGLQKIDWSRSNPIWEGKIMMEGKMIKNKTAIKSAANVILQKCGVNKPLEEFLE
ncbi:DNA sulfur modification protein DndB [Nitrosopumilus sp. b1]|nr:DNA sulfur modification protein DndB [Nitrosopumilus sp. b1]